MSALTQDDLKSAILFNAHHEIEDRKIACGFAHSQKRPYPVESPLSSWLIGGQTMQGKSSIATFFVLWFLAAGTQHILLLDPHLHNKARGLYTKLAALHDWFIKPPIDCLDVDALLAYIDWLEAEYHERRRCMDGKAILLVVIDEFNELLTSGLSKKQAERIATVLGNVARGGSKHGCYVLAIGHNFDMASSGGNAVRRNILGRVSVLAELGEMSNILDTSDRQRLKKLASSPRSMRPGDAIVKVPGYGLGRLFYPYISSEYLQDFVTFLHDVSAHSGLNMPKNGSYSAPECLDTPSPYVEPSPNDSTFLSPHLNVPEYDLNMPVSESEFTQIVQAGNKQIQESGKVVRTKIRDDLGWSSYDYEKKIKPVCDRLGWHHRMAPVKLSTEQKQQLRDAAGQCEKCGSTTDLEIDHIVPRAKGGPTTADNLQVLCKVCNQQKGMSTQKS